MPIPNSLSSRYRLRKIRVEKPYDPLNTQNHEITLTKPGFLSCGFVYFSWIVIPFQQPAGFRNRELENLDDAAYKIVFLSLGDHDVYDVASLRIHAFGNVINQHATVDVRSLRFHSTLPEQLALVRFAFEEHAHGFAYAGLVPATRDARLLFH